MKLIQSNVIEVLACTTRTSTANGSAVDVRDYEGPMHFILISEAGAGTTPTLDVKLQDDPASGGSYADISGATFTQVTDAADACEMITIQVGEQDRYIRAVATIGGTTPSYECAVVAVGNTKYGRNASQSV